MAIEIRQINPTSRRQLLKFVHFPIDTIYRDDKCYVPSLVTDEVNTLHHDKNPAFEYCDSAYFMAYRDGKPVGRIAGIINSVVNKRTGKPEARFGFIDFIDDDEVSAALIDAVTQWARAKGMKHLTGPMGFTDMDQEGMLIMGFDELGTEISIYNYEYYPRHMERLGFVKDADWMEYRITVPPEIPDKMMRIAQIVKQRYGLTTVRYTDRKLLVKEYGLPIFRLINEAYDDLFGYSPLTEKQMQHYIKIYLPFLPLDDISIIVKEDTRELIGVGITIPSLSQALIKCRGRLMPTGWWHLLQAFKHADAVDLLLVAIKPEYQSKGVNALLFTDLIPNYNKLGYKHGLSGPELEHNQRVQQQWQYFETELYRRRRAYTKEI